MKQVKVKDLKDQIGMIGPRPILVCRECGEEYSANAGDYWNASKDYVFKHCGVNMQLAVKKTVYQRVA